MSTMRELVEILKDRADPDDISDLLNLSTEDLLEAFSDRLEDREERIRDFLGVYGEESVD